MRTCQKCRVRKPDYEFPRKTGDKMGIQAVCKQCKEEHQKKKQEYLMEIERKRLIKLNQRKRQRIKDPVLRSFTIKASLDTRINEHLKKFGYPTKAAFFQTAAYHQLKRQEKINCNKQKRPDLINCGVRFSALTLNYLQFSTALSNYSSFCDFMRTAIKNRIEWECNYVSEQ